MAEKVAAELTLKHARFALELGQSKKKILIDHSKGKMIKALTGEVEAARARELAKLAELERERSALEKVDQSDWPVQGDGPGRRPHRVRRADRAGGGRARRTSALPDRHDPDG